MLLIRGVVGRGMLFKPSCLKMGKKKKQFIDKKKSVTFNLVHRSQRDPYYNDPEKSQMVLTEQDTHQELSHEKRLMEQEKYGIQFQDDYDYLQHLKDPTLTVEVPTHHQHIISLLPTDVFGTEVKTEGGKLGKVTPLRGPQVDWDPDIIAALDDDDTDNDKENDDTLEDDFILQANGGEPGIPVYVHDKDDGQLVSDEAEPWWKERGDYDTICEEHYNSEEEEEEGEGRFTNYSLTSADVPRSEGLSMLDERFEEFMAEYDDDQIGPLEETNEEKEIGEIENIILETAINEFDTKHRSATKKLTDVEGINKYCKMQLEESDSDSEEEIEVESGGRYKERWDCESILSTYSNLYNHPTVITEPSDHAKVKRHSVSSASDDISVPIKRLKAVAIRPKDECLEDKRARKQAIKEERRERRSIKKANKESFKREQLKLEKQFINNPPKTTIV